MNGKGDIIDGTKMWTDSELESITLFEVPKENISDYANSSTANAPSHTLTNDDAEETAATDSNANRSRDQSASNDESGYVSNDNSKSADVNSDETKKDASSRSGSSEKV